jgi:hypothetical protein
VRLWIAQKGPMRGARGSHEESEAETQDYFMNNFNSYFYNFVKVGVQVLRKNIYKLFPQTYLILEFSVK